MKKEYTSVNIDKKTLVRLRRCKAAFGASYTCMLEILMANAGLYDIPIQYEGDACARFMKHTQYFDEHGKINPNLKEMLE